MVRPFLETTTVFGLSKTQARGTPPEGLEGVEERPGKGLHLLVGDDLDVDPAGPLQTSREEVEDLPLPVEVLDLDLAKVVLAELPRESLEADQERLDLVAEATNQCVERGLAPRVPALPHPPKDLHGGEVGPLLQDRSGEVLVAAGHGGTAHRSTGPRRRAVLLQDP